MCALVNQLLDGGLLDLARGQEGGVTEKLKFFKKSKIAKREIRPVWAQFVEKIFFKILVPQIVCSHMGFPPISELT